MNNFFSLLRYKQHYQCAEHKAQGMSKDYVIELVIHSKLDYKGSDNSMWNWEHLNQAK